LNAPCAALMTSISSRSRRRSSPRQTSARSPRSAHDALPAADSATHLRINDARHSTLSLDWHPDPESCSWAQSCTGISHTATRSSADPSIGRPSDHARSGIQITRFGTTLGGHLGDQVADQIESSLLLLSSGCRGFSVRSRLQERVLSLVRVSFPAAW
jgi:hypothetical protein